METDSVLLKKISGVLTLENVHSAARTHTHTHTHTQPFYGSVDFVLDNPGEPVPEETFTHFGAFCTNLGFHVLSPWQARRSSHVYTTAQVF